ncbi:MAG: TlpA disulfide reductase family protein [Thermodesulfobacteriota bacterium]
MRRLLSCLALAVVLLGAVPPAPAADPPKAGDTLPVLALPAPDNPAHRAWLGIGGKAAFGIADVAADLVLIEIVGVYCPICYEQAPALRKLHARLARDPAFKGRVKLVAVAVGATPEELAFARKEHKADYPLVADPDFANHKLLGEPKTPFTLLVRRDGAVVLTHLGKIEDESEFAAKIRGLLP